MNAQKALTAMLLSSDPAGELLKFSNSPTSDIILPELNGLKMDIPVGLRHKDNFRHTLQVVSNAVELEEQGPDLTLRMAALLHDIGKPETRSFEGSKVSFTGHDAVGARMARERLKALGYPKGFIREVALLIGLHLRAFNYSPSTWTDAGVRRYVVDAKGSLGRLNKLIRADVTTSNSAKAELLKLKMDDLEARISRLEKEAKENALRPPLDGNEVMRIFEIESGPQLGIIMKELMALTRKGELKNAKEAERVVAAMLKNTSTS